MIHDRETAVVVLDMGSPAEAAEVGPFVRSYLAQRRSHPLPFWKEPLRGLLAQLSGTELAERWQKDLESVTIDSPLQRVNLAQAHGIAERLGCEGYAAALVGRPSLVETQQLMLAEGIKRVIPIVLDPMSPDQGASCIESFWESWQLLNASPGLRPTSPLLEESALYLDVFADHLNETLALIRDKATPLIFLARDPGRAAHQKGLEERAERQMRSIAERLGVLERSRLAWLPPRVDRPAFKRNAAAALERAKAEGQAQVVLVPLGWVADRFETLYDIDLMLTRIARAAGMRTFRVPTLNDRAEFLDALARIVAASLKGESSGA